MSEIKFTREVSASMTSVYVVLWQTIGNILIGYGLWNYLLHRYDASVVTPWYC